MTAMMERNVRTNLSPPNPTPIDEQRPQFSKLRRGCVNVDSWLQSVSETVVKSVFWRLLIAGLTLVLLFGSSMQMWAVPKEGDTGLDALYLFGFVIFMIDVVFNAYADPGYLVCVPCNSRTSNRSSQTSRDFFCRQQQFCGVGSFNFWCDLISSVGFLYDVSFINQTEFAMQYVYIQLDLIGVPVRNAKRNHPSAKNFVHALTHLAHLCTRRPTSTM
jgi:hypothetical protein